MLKALGFTNGRVMALVLAESCLLSGLGGVLGLGLAWLAISRGDPTGGMLPLFFYEDAEVSLQVVRTLYKAGVRVMEYTNRAKEAFENLKILKKVK